MAGNALLDFAKDLANPPLDAAIRRLVGQHGAVKVRDAVKRLTTLKKGRKPEKDWNELAPWIDLDAKDWLDGNDPFAIRSNYFLAKIVVAANPGHNPVATHRRVMGKLSSKRRRFLLITAWQTSESERPFGDYFRACAALADNDPLWSEYVISQADSQRGKLERYRDRFGDPDENMTMTEIDEALKAMPTNALLQYASQGLLGSTITNALAHYPGLKK